MRIVWIFGLLVLLGGCSSYSVHCNKHLRPINVPERAVSAPGSMKLPASGSPASAATGAASGKP